MKIKLGLRLVLLISCLIIVFLYNASFKHEINKVGSNTYFFKGTTTSVEYEGYFIPLSSREIEQNVTLNIDRLKTFEIGTLYALWLNPLNVSDPWDQISMGREKLGYFYVTDDKIYRWSISNDMDFSDEENKAIIDVIAQYEEGFFSEWDIVCSETSTADVPDSEGWHKYVEVDGDRRIFRCFNEYEGGTRYYETIIWEKEKGITYYRSGSGSMLMHIEFGTDATAFDKGAALN